MLKSLMVSIAILSVAACADESEPVTCDEVIAESSVVELGTGPAECGVAGYGYVVAGVSYYDSEADITWFQRYRDYGGEYGVVGQLDQWTAGCYWLPCDVTR